MPVLERIFIAAERRLGSALARVARFRHRPKLLAEAPARQLAPDEPRWSRSGPAPRSRNKITLLLDGEAYFTQLWRALESAKHYVLIVGWCLTPHIPLLRQTADDLLQTQVLTVLSETAARVPVRVLLWGGAIAVIQPTRGYVREVERSFREQGSGDLVCRADTTAQATHCDHQKAIVIDGKLAFVGGIDLTTFAGDRWDTRVHEMRAGVNWHDAAVLVQGEAVQDVESNFRERWQAVNGGPLPAPMETSEEGTTQAQIVRTIPAGKYAFRPEGEFGVSEAYARLIPGANRLIYLESQYLWAPEIMELLLEKIERPPSSDFRTIVVLPARATSGKWDNDKHVEMLRKADDGRGVVEVYSLFTSGPASGRRPFRYRPIYVHAKLGVFDDEWFIVGSANLNDRGLKTDSEICVMAHEPELARSLRLDLWSEHLKLEHAELARADTRALIDEVWRDQASANAGIMLEGKRPLVSQVRRYEAGRTPGAWVLDETEALTFEH